MDYMVEDLEKSSIKVPTFWVLGVLYYWENNNIR